MTRTFNTDSQRTIKAARGLHARYANPEVGAMNRARNAKTERARLFWFRVGCFLHRPASRLSDYDMWRLQAIRSVKEAA